MTVHNHSRIAPFGHLRVKGHLHLTAAFRSLSRPSSADIAKASTVCSYYLNLCKIHTLTFLASQDASASCCLKDSPSVRQKTFRVKYFFRFLLLYSFQRTDFLIKDQDGGDEENRTPDPAAPSDTATLLRLHSNHQLRLRRLAPYGYLTGFGCF